MAAPISCITGLQAALDNLQAQLDALMAQSDCCPVGFNMDGNTLQLLLNEGGPIEQDLSQFVDVFEPVTVDGFTLAGNTATITQSNGTSYPLDLTQFMDDVTVQDFNLTGNVAAVTLTNGTVFPLDLSQFLDDVTVQDFTIAGNTATITLTNGSTFPLDLSQFLDDTDTVIDGATLTGNTLTITHSGGGSFPVDLSQFMDDTVINGASLVGNTLTITASDGNSYPVDLSQFMDDITVQQWGLSGNNLTLQLTDGTSLPPIDLSGFLDDTNTFATNLSLGGPSGTTLIIDMNDGSQLLQDLSGILTKSSVTNNGDGTYTHSDGASPAVTQLIDTRAVSNPYDPATDPASTLTSTNVQDAIDELATTSEGWRISGAAGPDGAQAEPTRDDALLVTNEKQSIGGVIIGGAVGDTRSYLGSSHFEVQTGLFINADLRANPQAGFLYINSNTNDAVANERLWRMHVNANPTADWSAALSFFPRNDANTANSGAGQIAGFQVDRGGNIINAGQFLQNVSVQGSTRTQYFQANADDSNQGPTAPPDASVTWEFAQRVGGLAEKWVGDAAGNITQESSHNAIIADVLGQVGVALNHTSFNVFSGRGEGIDPRSGRTAVFDIDTGAYDIVARDGSIESSGLDARLAFGEMMRPLASIGYEGERGREFWEFMQDKYTENSKKLLEHWLSLSEEEREGEQPEIHEYIAPPKYLETQFALPQPGQGKQHAWDISSLYQKATAGVMAASAVLASFAWIA